MSNPHMAANKVAILPMKKNVDKAHQGTQTYRTSKDLPSLSSSTIDHYRMIALQDIHETQLSKVPAHILLGLCELALKGKRWETLEPDSAS